MKKKKYVAILPRISMKENRPMAKTELTLYMLDYLNRTTRDTADLIYKSVEKGISYAGR